VFDDVAAGVAIVLLFHFDCSSGTGVPVDCFEYWNYHRRICSAGYCGVSPGIGDSSGRDLVGGFGVNSGANQLGRSVGVYRQGVRVDVVEALCFPRFHFYCSFNLDITEVFKFILYAVIIQ